MNPDPTQPAQEQAKAKLAMLHPIALEHPAHCAYYITMSPHEWTWSQKEQEAMAQTIVSARVTCSEVAELLAQIARDPARSCHIERLARMANEKLGFNTDEIIADQKKARDLK